MTFRRSCPTSLPERVTPASSGTSRTLSFAKIVTVLRGVAGEPLEQVT